MKPPHLSRAIAMEKVEHDGWGEWRRHVLIEMEEHSKSLKEIRTAMSQMKTDVALLKYKSSVWGASGAGIVLLVYMGIAYFTHH
jgi:hypothetical protein